MDIVSTFLPVAVQLIDQAFPTPISYERASAEQYDPATGAFSRTPDTYSINAGVLGARRNERDGPREVREVRLWIHHGQGGLPFTPTTGDLVTLEGEVWRVVDVDPAYLSTGLIASRVTCEYQRPAV